MDKLIQIGTELFVLLLLLAMVFAFRKKRRFQTSKHVIYGVLVFVLFASVFSFHRHEIYAFNSWIFAMTGEIEQIKFSEGEKDNPGVAATAAKGATPNANKAANPKAPGTTKKLEPVNPDDATKPVRSNLPMTPKSKILFVPAGTLQNIDEKKLPLFPELRSYNGTEWKEEKTEIRMASDGQNLYASFLCYDSAPANLTTKFSETEGTTSAWKDDSIEFFLMKDKNADSYYQIAASASGLCHVNYIKTTEDNFISGVYQTNFPPEFKKPFVSSEKCTEGYKVTIELDLQSLGFGKLDIGKEILMQVVRNYRDIADPSSAELQLYPTFIYGDNRYGSQNHDRRAFMPSKLAK